METASFKQAVSFSKSLLGLRREGALEFSVGGVLIEVDPEPNLKPLGLQFTDGDLETVCFEVRVHDPRGPITTRLYISAGHWEGRASNDSYFPNGLTHFIHIHGHARRDVHQLDLKKCLSVSPNWRGGKVWLQSRLPFPMKGGRQARELLTDWLSSNGLLSSRNGLCDLGTDAELKTVLVNLLTLGILKQHLRGNLIIPSLVDELPPAKRPEKRQEDQDVDDLDFDVDDEVAATDEDNLSRLVEEDLEALAAEEDPLDRTPGVEGSIRERYVRYYERLPRLRVAALRIHGTECQACGFDFEEIYGEHGRGFIEVHHIKPLSSILLPEAIDPARDLRVLCANCHRMAHRKTGHVLSVEELRQLLKGYSSRASS